MAPSHTNQLSIKKDRGWGTNVLKQHQRRPTRARCSVQGLLLHLGHVAQQHDYEPSFLSRTFFSPQTFTFTDQATLTHYQTTFPRPLSSTWCSRLRGPTRLTTMLVHWGLTLSKSYTCFLECIGEKSFIGLTKGEVAEEEG